MATQHDRIPYADIIHLSRPASAREPMPLSDRAAQFSPFAALTGHEDAVQEAARYVEERTPLSNAERDELDRRLNAIRAALPERPPVMITRFVADPLKPGGTYLDHAGRVRAFDEAIFALVFEDGERIAVEDIVAISLIAPEDTVPTGP